jgi:hypothetical protein
MPRIIEEALARHTVLSKPDLDGILEADRWGRETVINDIVPNL